MTYYLKLLKVVFTQRTLLTNIYNCHEKTFGDFEMGTVILLTDM